MISLTMRRGSSGEVVSMSNSSLFLHQSAPFRPLLQLSNGRTRSALTVRSIYATQLCAPAISIPNLGYRSEPGISGSVVQWHRTLSRGSDDFHSLQHVPSDRRLPVTC